MQNKHTHTHTHTHARAHTHTCRLINDGAFGLIARKARKKDVIASPRQWMRLAAGAKCTPRFNCVWFEQKLHRNVRAFLAQTYVVKGAYKTIDGETLRFMSDARWLNYGVGEDDDGVLKTHPGEVWVRYSFSSNGASTNIGCVVQSV